MTRILQIGLSYERGGVESFVMNYYRRIDRSKVQFDFINPYGAPLAYQDEMNTLGAKVYEVSDFHSSPFQYKEQLKNIMKNYEIVHVHMLSAANIIPLKVARKCGVKRIIAHAHSTLAEGLVRAVLHQINYRNISKLATDLFSCSEKAGEWMFGKEKNFTVINNAIDIIRYEYNLSTRNEIRDAMNISQTTVVYGNVGRLGVPKNQLFLLDIFKDITKIQPNSVLLIVGDGEFRQDLENKIRKLELNDRVFLLGVRTDVDRLYNAMDAIIMPSIFEGLPITLVESQANGLKCFVSDKCVPYESKIIDTMEFIGLNEPSATWAKRIVNSDTQRYINAAEALSLRHYNITEESNRLLKCYLE